MIVESLELFNKHRGKKLLVDTNLLLLVLVGRFNRTAIQQFKRTRAYTFEDFDLLEKVIRLFDQIVVTPNILTEVSNLAGQIGRDHFADFLKTMALQIVNLKEQYISSIDASQKSRFERVGLTDSTVFCIAECEVLVLTDDFRLAGMLESDGFDVVNFNHVREMTW